MSTNQPNRPLSPHIQVYRPQLTSVLSFSHRATGIALAAGSIVLTAWLLALAGGRESYESMQSLLGSVLGRLVLLGFTWALYYHLANGIRHLFWDAGKGFELEAAYRSGKAVVVVSIVLTVITWIAAYAWRGA